MNVLLCGDPHGSSAYLRRCLDAARRQGCSQVYLLGDVGYNWPGADGERFTRHMMEWPREYGIDLLWLDGNHDNHTWREVVTGQNNWKWPIELAEHLFYLPRGCRWEVDGLKFGALGGSFSVDWHYRTPYKSWWENEAISDEDILRLGSERLDVLLTHDGPISPPPAMCASLPKQDELRCNMNQQLVHNAMLLTRPTLLAHGHQHHRRTYSLRCMDNAWTVVEALGCDSDSFSSAVVMFSTNTCGERWVISGVTNES